MISKPGEVYSYGTIIVYATLFSPIGVMLGSMFYLPVFLQLEIVSIYKVRTTSALSCIIILYTCIKVKLSAVLFCLQRFFSHTCGMYSCKSTFSVYPTNFTWNMSVSNKEKYWFEHKTNPYLNCLFYLSFGVVFLESRRGQNRISRWNFGIFWHLNWFLLPPSFLGADKIPNNFLVGLVCFSLVLLPPRYISWRLYM